MTAWTSDELTLIDAAEELQVASTRSDGTLRTPVTIWVVRHGGDLYVARPTGAPPPGSAAPRCVTRATSGPAG